MNPVLSRWIPAAVLLGTLVSVPAQAQVPRADLEPMFSRLRQAGWNVDGPLLWSYFFVGKDALALAGLRGELESRGYAFVTLSTHRNGILLMQVNRTEAHTVASLDRRNQELSGLAARHGGVEYEGMEPDRLSRR